MKLGKSPQKMILIADDDLVNLTTLRSIISNVGYLRTIVYLVAGKLSFTYPY